jgi:intracellular septation protein
MKYLFDSFPVLIFLVAYFVYTAVPASYVSLINSYFALGITPGLDEHSIYFATLMLIAAALVQISYLAIFKKIEKIYIVSFGLILIAGGATLVLKNPLFIQWKPTILYWVIAIIFFATPLVSGINLVERFAGKTLQLDKKIWEKLNYIWVIFFFIMGLLNIYVAYNFSQAFWVQFKFFGLAIGFPILFILLQAVLLAPHIKEENE